MLVVFAGTAMAADGASPLSRPANFYRLAVENDSSCGPILKSLNEPYRPANPSVVTNPNLIGEVLLTSRLQVAWRRSDLHEPTSSAISVLDAAEVDLENNGHPVAVYRHGLETMNRELNELIVAAAPLKELPSQIALGDTAVKEFAGARGERIVNINVKTAPELYASDPPRDDSFVLNVLSLNGKAVLVVANAIDAGNTVWAKKPINAWVLQYHGATRMSLLCRFRGSGKQR